MSRSKDSSLSAVFQKAEEALSEIEDARLVLKLLAIRGYGNLHAKEVAKLFNTQTRTVYKWVELFKLHGVDGLRDRQKGHRAALLSPEHRQEIAKWIDAGKTPQGAQIHWTLDKLCQHISQEFGVEIKKSALSITLKKMHYCIRKPRPTHAQSSPEGQAVFKKNSRNH